MKQIALVKGKHTLLGEMVHYDKWYRYFLFNFLLSFLGLLQTELWKLNVKVSI